MSAAASHPARHLLIDVAACLRQDRELGHDPQRGRDQLNQLCCLLGTGQRAVLLDDDDDTADPAAHTTSRRRGLRCERIPAGTFIRRVHAWRKRHPHDEIAVVTDDATGSRALRALGVEVLRPRDFVVPLKARRAALRAAPDQGPALRRPG